MGPATSVLCILAIGCTSSPGVLDGSTGDASSDRVLADTASTDAAIDGEVADGALDATPPDAASRCTSFRLLVYNIQHGRFAGQGDPVTEAHLDNVANVITEARADVVLLQEVDMSTTRSSGVQQAQYLAMTLGYDFAFSPSLSSFQGGQYGNAVLSRSALISEEFELLPRTNGEQRSVLMTTSDPDGCGLVGLWSTHFQHTDAGGERLMQAQRLNALVASVGHPVILGGDLNAEPGSPTLMEMASAWFDPTDGLGLATFPKSAPTRQIDYLLFERSTAWQSQCEVWDTQTSQASSDHLPLHCEISRSAL